MYRDYYLHRLKNLLLKEANKKFAHLATHDPLTGMGNRRYFEEIIEKELVLIERYKREGTLLLLDVDHFKRINDTYGHDTGDQVLQGIADLLNREIREEDLSARWGGEEFILFFPAQPGGDSFLSAERLRRLFAETPLSAGDITISITVSIGMAAISPGVNTSFDKAYKEVDKALYEAKKSGRNRVVVSS